MTMDLYVTKIEAYSEDMQMFTLIQIDELSEAITIAFGKMNFEKENHESISRL
jgi:hypothetical protein